ncbi:cytochrome c oxidase subunit II [Malonomonas rubra]|uniref:cytochrome c oxidase subunit II n=1 Tax=Malonomonas rubra TaxID=57040 RepID=UPI0026F12BC0|nr:cytochrome c oxidase subunit II [Malonomonas rubra]
MNSLANPTAQAVDSVLIYIFGFSLLLLLGITAATIWMVIKYRRSKYPEPTSQVSKNIWLETIWTLLPTLIVLTMFWYGWANYTGLRDVPKDALEVKATARMWSWTFEYPDGRRENKLYIPVGKPVKVMLYSTDVLHSFFAPAFRIKRDTVPGMETYIWFEATEPGSYDVFCAEYCGVGHADMTTSIEALSDADYAAWLAAKTSSGGPRGLTLLNELGCTSCHSLDGSAGIGPSLFRLSAHEGGQPFDAEHIRRAIRDPGIEVTEGYAPIMPAYGKDQLNETDLQAIIDYLTGKQIKDVGLDVGELLENNGCLGCHSIDGSQSIAPTFKGISSHPVTVISNGEEKTIKVDKDYLRRALLEPNEELVKGYPGIMPAADYLSKKEIEAIIEYLLKQ